MTARLNVNIDHVATVREARKTIEPSVVEAANLCEKAGADGITIHLRQDRRHIQDRDLEQLRSVVSTYLNLEHAVTDEMLLIAERVRPDAVSLVPESPNEITTEGGLDVAGNVPAIADAVRRLKAVGIHVSIFIDPSIGQIDAAAEAGADQVEICTAEYAEMTLDREDQSSDPEKVAAEIARIAAAAKYAKEKGIVVAAGHGLTTKNVGALASMPEISEFNIGHHIISRSIFIGLENAVTEMIEAINVR